MDIFKRGPSVLNVVQPSGDVLTILNNRFFVGVDFYDDVRQRFELMYPNLLLGEDYSPAELVGYSYWAGLTAQDRNVCVLILKDFALLDSPLITDWTTRDGTKLMFFVNYLESIHDCESTDVSSGFEE
jgi:hypothetical protein